MSAQSRPLVHADIRPENPPERASHYLDVPNMPWENEGVCGPGQFVWRPAGNQHEAVAPDGAVLLGFFLKPNRFAYGEKFFTEEGAR
jgi:hypothetical protein